MSQTPGNGDDPSPAPGLGTVEQEHRRIAATLSHLLRRSQGGLDILHPAGEIGVLRNDRLSSSGTTPRNSPERRPSSAREPGYRPWCSPRRPWTLAAVYGLTPADIAVVVAGFLDNAHLALQDADAVTAALQHFRGHPSLGSTHCLVVGLARKAGYLPLGMFDRSLARVEGAKALWGSPVLRARADLTTDAVDALPRFGDFPEPRHRVVGPGHPRVTPARCLAMMFGWSGTKTMSRGPWPRT